MRSPLAGVQLSIIHASSPGETEGEDDQREQPEDRHGAAQIPDATGGERDSAVDTVVSGLSAAGPWQPEPDGEPRDGEQSDRDSDGGPEDDEQIRAALCGHEEQPCADGDSVAECEATDAERVVQRECLGRKAGEQPADVRGDEEGSPQHWQNDGEADEQSEEGRIDGGNHRGLPAADRMCF